MALSEEKRQKIAAILEAWDAEGEAPAQCLDSEGTWDDPDDDWLDDDDETRMTGEGMRRWLKKA